MRITDYQSGRELKDVSIVLTEDELSELAVYVQKLNHDHHVSRAFLTEFVGPSMNRELTVAVEQRLNHQMAS